MRTIAAHCENRGAALALLPGISLEKERHVRVLFCLLALSFTAKAGTLTGQIDDPSLRRKTQLVYLENVPGKFAAPASPAIMNQIHNTYSPRVLVVLAGQKVEFRSEDPELHNVNARAEKTQIFNQAILPHMMYARTFDKPGLVHLSCNVHKEMSADILVAQNPYYAKPDASGHFTIDGVPAGNYKLRIFGPELNDEQRAKTYTVSVGATTAPLKLAMR
jgi:plastocyanin